MAEFNFSYEPGTSLEQMIGFEVAGQIWSSYLQDNTEVNIHIEGTNQLPSNVIGGALPAIEAKQKYEDISEALKKDVTSALDTTAAEHLSTQKEFSVVANGDTDLKKTKQLNATTANSKALGLIEGDPSKLDGYILFSDLSQTPVAQWDYNVARDAAAGTNSLDFLSVALHEIGHVLGFVSGVDDPGWLNTVLEGQQKIEKERRKGKEKSIDNLFKDEAMKFAHPLDLFRYSNESAAQGKQDHSIGGDAYFSVDGGQTAIANFSSGKATNLGGDGYQASHWQHSNETPLGILDPALAANQRRNISSIDLAAFDAIGWDVAEHPLEINFGALKAAAEVKLADQLGVSSQWLGENAESAAQQLAESRIEDIVQFIKESEVYEWGRSTASSGWGWYRQEILNLFEQQSLFATLDENSFPPSESQEQPAGDGLFYPASSGAEVPELPEVKSLPNYPIASARNISNPVPIETSTVSVGLSDVQTQDSAESLQSSLPDVLVSDPLLLSTTDQITAALL
ncbi:MAG: NF038122 family metalloprotease [Thermosynechococcaceae cyanobacterium]